MHGYRENEYPAPEPLTPEREAFSELIVEAIADNMVNSLWVIQAKVLTRWVFDGIESELLCLEA